MTFYLGVDIGTFESKGALVDENGTIIATAAKPHKMLVPKPGWAEHRADEDWWGDFVHITQDILQQTNIDPETIGAIGCSAIGPCMLPVDNDGKPLCNAALYGVDNRASAQVDALTDRIGEDVLVAKCGNALTSQSVGPKVLWLKEERPDIYAETAKVLSSTSYLVFKLTGEFAIDHYTAANFSPLYVIDDAGWSTELADDIIDVDRLAPIAWSTDIVGTVTRKAAEDTGLATGTPVICGTIDAAAEAVSVGVSKPGEMMVMYGSTIFTIMVSAERIADPRLWYAPWLYEGQHASMAGLATSGTLTHWFRDQFARDLDPENAFSVLLKEARGSLPGANGLLLLPYFSGERTPIHDPDAKGVLFGLNLTHTRADMYRAFLEGIAFGTADIIQTYRDIGQPPDTLFAVGGGAKNDIWLQATSDACGTSQVLRQQSMGAAYGDAFLAAQAVGAVDPADIDRWNARAGLIVPREDLADLYGNLFQIYRDLYRQTRSSMKALTAFQS